jgi:hypothetical protein
MEGVTRIIGLVIGLPLVFGYLWFVRKYQPMQKLTVLLAERTFKKMTRHEGMVDHWLEDKRDAVQKQYELRDAFYRATEQCPKGAFTEELQKIETRLNKSLWEMNFACGLALLAGHGKTVTKFMKGSAVTQE